MDKHRRQHRPVVGHAKVAATPRHTLTRTRSESDLIRAVAKQRNADSFQNDFSDDESSLSSTDEYGRITTSLRSFHTADEERFAVESAAHFKEMATAIKEDRAKALGCTPEEEEEEEETGAAKIPAILDHISASSPQSNVTPMEDTTTSKPQSDELQSCANSSSFSKPNATEAPSDKGGSYGSVESTTSTTDIPEPDVDLEYLLHENDLLKKSLEDVTQERNGLARENWILNQELEQTRLQMFSLMSRLESRQLYPSLTGSPPMYTSTGSPQYQGGMGASRDYAYHGHAQESHTFEELFNN